MPEAVPPTDAAFRTRCALEIRKRLAPLRLAPAREAEIVEELSQHLADRRRELMSGGASPDEAAGQAFAEFSEARRLTAYLAPLRQAHPPEPVTPGAPGRSLFVDLWFDVRYAVRTMAARPAFAIVAILSLSLGIGANTAIFSLWNGVLHASLPAVRDPGALVILSNPDESGSWTGNVDGPRDWLTYQEFEQLRDRADVFSGLMASQSSLDDWQARIDGEAWEEVRGRMVSGGFFEVLGAGAEIGRVFTASEDRTAMPIAVISHSYWQRRFGRGDVLGRAITIRGVPFVIVGVAARGFIGETSGQDPDVWLPLRMQPVLAPGRDRLHDTPPEKSMWLHLFGRLKPDVTATQAEAQVNALFQAGLQSFYGAVSGERRRELLDQRILVRPASRGASVSRPQFSQSLSALLAAVGVLLLIACANLANLVLARGTTRRPEFALRLSLGASRGRLVRQLITENLVLAAVGAVAALVVASVLHDVLVGMLTASNSAFRMPFALDPVVLVFVLAATVAAMLLCGVFPAWQVTRGDAADSMRNLSRGSVAASGQLRSSRLLVGLQLALSLPLLVGAGLLARTAFNLQHADLGFPADRLLMVRVDTTEGGYGGTRSNEVVGEALAEIRRVAGVRSASFSKLGIFTGGESSETIEVEGYTPKPGEDRDTAVDTVGPGYFSTLGVPLMLGRDIADGDRAGAPAVCVINEAFAKKFFAGRNPIGLSVTAVYESDRSTCHVVGVAGNARTQRLRGEVVPRYFVAAAQSPSSALSPTFLIRTATEAPQPLAAVRKTIQRVDAALPIVSARSLEERLGPLTAQEWTTAQLAVAFGSIALVLAAIGLYGLLSYGVARRTGEIAVRMALGARRSGVIAMILREAVTLVAAGLGVGGVLAYAASRLIGSRLYGVAPQDPLTLLVAPALLLIISLAAAYLPAHRASRLDPMTALRQS